MELDGILEILSLGGLVFYIIFSAFIIFLFISLKKIAANLFHIVNSSMKSGVQYLDKFGEDFNDLNYQLIRSFDSTDNILLSSQKISDDISETKEKFCESLDNADILIKSANNNSNDVSVLTHNLQTTLDYIDILGSQLQKSIGNIDNRLCDIIQPVKDIKSAGQNAVNKSKLPIGQLFKYYSVINKSYNIFRSVYRR